jgi:guanosine-3',5'-bis(diphosphate) 3'-pyrophosphohydrolase
VGKISDEAVLCAALLHDTIEDTETTAVELRALFGEAICGIVLEVTDDKSLPKERRKALQVEHAAHASLPARLVKLGDKICNVVDITNSPPGDWSTTRRLEYLDWSERVVAGCRGSNAALEEHFDSVIATARRSIGGSAHGSVAANSASRDPIA